MVRTRSKPTIAATTSAIRISSCALAMRDIVHAAAVHGQHLCGDPARFGGSEKRYRVGDVLWLSDAAEHRFGGETLFGRGPIAGAAAALCQVGADEAGRYRVYGDVVRAKLHGEALGQYRDLGFAGGIEGVAGKSRAERGDRTDIDDPAVTPRPHVADDRARGID